MDEVIGTSTKRPCPACAGKGFTGTLAQPYGNPSYWVRGTGDLRGCAKCHGEGEVIMTNPTTPPRQGAYRLSLKRIEPKPVTVLGLFTYACDNSGFLRHRRRTK
jgi:hypothetical protein